MENIDLNMIDSYVGPILAGVFFISLLLVIAAWTRLVRLAIRLEKARHGWSDDGLLRQFRTYRRNSVANGGKRMSPYLREDLKVLAEEGGASNAHRQAINMLHLGYGGAVASGLTHILLIAMSEGIG